LRKLVDKVDFQEQPLSDVLEWLREQGDINVVVVWRALPMIDEDKSVTLLLKDATLAEVLNELMAQLDEEGNAMYRAQRNTIRISSKQDFNRKLFVRVYDVTDMLQRTPDYAESAPQIDMNQVAQAGQGSGGGGRSIFTNTGTNIATQQARQGEQEQTARVTTLVDLIQRSIEPLSWANVGGEGDITSFNTSIVVRNSVEVHEAIAGWFKLED